MELLLFVLLSLLVLAVPMGAMVQVQRRMDLEKSWYGLLVMGAGAVVAAWMGIMGLLVIHAWAFLPHEMPVAALRARLDVIFIVTFLLGVALEGAKSYGVKVFDTRLTRGDWTLYGLAVGVGAGLVQAFWYLGARAWTVASGVDGIGAADGWLLLRCATLVALEASLGAQVMYHTARNRRVAGVLAVGALHGLTLMVPALLARAGVGAEVEAWLASACNLTTALGAALLLARWIKVRGWPT